jgi:DNA-binding SARP family transcriptional activator
VTAETEFGLLGPLLVRHSGSVTTLPAGKQRALLAVLLLNPNLVVGVDEIAEVLWGADPPPSAQATTQNYVKRLRKALDRDSEARIGTAPRGYLIRIEPGELDVARFEATQQTAAKAARQGHWEQAANGLHEALSLWRGEPLADVHSAYLAQRYAPRLAEMRLQALEARIDADLHLGRHRDVIAELRQFTAAHPLRERLHALLMLALYRDGQQGEALAAYRQARRTLIEELGAEPGLELRQLEHQVLTADPVLDALPAIPPAGLATAPGPPQPGWPTPRLLPAPVRHFAGRRRELDALTGLLDAARGEAPQTVVISAIAGTAGVGKTALAVRWAHQVADGFPDGQLYVNLRGADPGGQPLTPADAIFGFLTALRVPAEQIPQDADARRGLYRSLVAGRRMLILLDNARDADQVRPLLPGGPGCLVAVTSRSPLASLVAAEGAYPLSLDVLSETDAQELLAKRLGPERIAAEPAAAAELTARCARLPLALAIAAARAVLHPSLPLADLVAELRDADSRLDTLDAGDAVSSVRAAFSWSYQHLPPPTARMFRLLGLHPGPDISVAAAASLAGTSLDDTRQALGQLVQSSLLSEDMPGRFAFHDLLRVYAAEVAASADSSEKRQAAFRRMLDHYLHTALTAQLAINPNRLAITVPPAGPGVLPEQVADIDQAIAWFEVEYRVLLGAIRQAAQADLDIHAWQLPTTLATFLDQRGYWESYVDVMRTGLAAARRLGDTEAQAVTHRRLGAAQRLRGCYQDAQAHSSQALELYRQLGDGSGQGRAHMDLGAVLSRQSRLGDAIDQCLQALEKFQATGEKSWHGNTLNNIGYYHAQLGNHEQALAYCQEAMSIFQEVGHRRGEAFAWDSIGFAQQHLGHHVEAVDCYRRALAISRELGLRLNEADVLTHLGDAHQAAGQSRSAREAWQHAVEILEDLNHPSAGQVRDRLRQEPT